MDERKRYLSEMLRASEFSPHPRDATAVNRISDLNVRFRVDQRGHVWSVAFVGNSPVDGLSALVGMPNLIDVKILYQDDETVGLTSVGGSTLSSIECLGRLYIQNSPAFSNAGVKALSSHKRICWLNLLNCGITDEGVKLIGNMPGLHRLNLWGNGITDDSLPVLLRMSNLKMLGLTKTNVTSAAIEQLRLRLSNCKVFCGDGVYQQ